ncbi:MAG: MmcQ/YjbR family DNA-binding protein [Ignavibacteriota bacterium]
MCLKLPHTTEEILWGSWVFKVGGKMYAVAALEPGKVWLSFKCSRKNLLNSRSGRGSFPPHTWRAIIGWRSRQKRR